MREETMNAACHKTPALPPSQNSSSVLYKDYLIDLLRRSALQQKMQEVSSSSPSSPEAVTLDHCYPVKEPSNNNNKIILALGSTKTKVNLKTNSHSHFLSQTGPLKITIFKKPLASQGNVYAATPSIEPPRLPSPPCSNGEHSKPPKTEVVQSDTQHCNGVSITPPIKTEDIKEEIVEEVIDVDAIKTEDEELPEEKPSASMQSSSKKRPKKASANGTKAKPPTQTKGKRKKPQKYKGKRKKIKESTLEEGFDIPNQFKKKAPMPKKEVFDPFIRIEGRKESPYSVTVFNPSSSDDAKPAKKQKEAPSALNLRKKFCFRATSQNYDNINEDKTWRCAFCHTKNNIYRLGDLFGPYYHRNCDSSSKDNEEMWVHEACAVWTPGVYLRDSQLVGLEDTLRDSLQYSCHHCKATGATICCNKNKCQKIYHYFCSIQAGCKLDPDNLNMACPGHSSTSLCT